jgi:hypothetical protein
VVLGIPPPHLDMLGKQSITKLHPSPRVPNFYIMASKRSRNNTTNSYAPMVWEYKGESIKETAFLFLKSDKMR